MVEQVWCQQERTGRAHLARRTDIRRRAQSTSPRKKPSRVGHFQHLRTDGWERRAANLYWVAVLALGHAGTVNALFCDMALATCFASRVERRRPLPVDALIPEPIFTSTHAITIDAPPERVWPWIAQMGAGRAGWYSWDAIDNGGTPSATSIMPAFQTVVSGDVMPAIPGAKDAFVVAAVDPPRDLVLTVPDGRGGNAVAWEHVLDPLPGRQNAADRARTSVLALARPRSCDAARRSPPHLHRTRVCGAGEASASAADRIRCVGPSHDGSAPSARYSAPQHCGVGTTRSER